MKLEITEKGVHDADGKRVPVGAIIEVKGDVVPASLVNKARRAFEVERPRGKAKGKAPELTREGIAEMDEAGIDDLLAAHGVTADGASLEDKRAALIKIVFLDA